MSATISEPFPPRAGNHATRADAVWLALLWLVATAANLRKPYHIDDAAHLTIARWIAGHPLHPMSGPINLDGRLAPIWHTNQPQLYFYALALWSRIAGFGEVPMHALQSLFTLAAIVLMYRLARALVPRDALVATALVILGPAFIVEQNLMVDVPLLALWLGFFCALLIGRDGEMQTRRYLCAASLCSAALLVKYSSLVLVAILWGSLAFERRRAQWWTALVPVAVLAGWSAFNFADYGGVHILSRPTNAADGANGPVRWLEFAVAWFNGLGALTPLGYAMWIGGRGGLRAWRFAFAGLALFAAFVALVAMGIASPAVSDALLLVACALNAGCIVAAIWPALRAFVQRRVADPADAYLAAWIIATSLFYIAFAPFMAARHLLLILPAVTLLVIRRAGSLRPAPRFFALALTVVVSTGLCIADWRFAAFYRDAAKSLARELPHTGTYVNGHWGWQWYAAAGGLPEIDDGVTVLHAGDTVAIASDVSRQDVPLPPGLVLRPEGTIVQTQPLANLLCTARIARFYSYNYQRVPWSISRECVGHIAIMRVVAQTKIAAARRPRP